MKATIYNQKAEKVGEVELNSKIFEVEPNEHLLAEAVRIQLLGARQGNAHSKTRGEVSGGGKKPWKQKGTGRARAGSTRGPIWRHGGVALGPRSNRNWELKLNKKAKTKALFMTLSEKAKGQKLIVIDRMQLEKPKTSEFVSILQGFKKAISDLGKKNMILMPKKDDALVRASRNIPSVFPTMANSLNLVDVMNVDSILILKDSLGVLEKTYLKVKEEKK